jgi:hypothetical protein
MNTLESLRRVEQDPRVRQAYRRQVWLEIYLPLALAVAAGAAGLVVNWSGIVAGASSLADIMLAGLLIPFLLVLLPLIAIVLAGVYAVGLGIRSIPAPASKVQARLEMIAHEARGASTLAARPLVSLAGAQAAAAAAWRKLTARWTEPF